MNRPHLFTRPLFFGVPSHLGQHGAPSRIPCVPQYTCHLPFAPQNPPANAGDLGSILGREAPPEKEMAAHSSILAWRISWTGEPGGCSPWGPTPVSLPGESHGQGSLAGYSPWGRKESGTAERLNDDSVGKGFEKLFCFPPF